MPETPTTRRATQVVMAVSSDRSWLEALAVALSVVPDITCRPIDLTSFREGRFNRAADVIILDIDDGEALRDERLFAMRQELAKVPLVVISRELPHDLARQVIRLGSADWLQKPVENRLVTEAVLHLLRIGGIHENRVYAVMSCVGGAGATTLAITAAHVFGKSAKGAPNNCALIDLDFTKGSCGAYLDVHNNVDLTGVIENPSRVDAEFMDLVRRDYRDLFSVFSFVRPEISVARTGEEFVLRMMDVLSYQYRHTVVDVPFHYTAWRDRIFEVADGIILTTELTIPAIRQAQVIYGMIRENRKADQNVIVVVNRHRSRLFSRGIRRKDIAKTFAGASLQFLPYEWDTLSDAVNRGIAPADAAPRSGFVRKAGKLVTGLQTRELT